MSRVDVIDVDEVSDNATPFSEDKCLICALPLAALDDDERAAHYDAHYPPDETSLSAACKPSTSKLNPSRLFSASAAKAPGSPNVDKENVFWHRALAPADPPPNFTPGCVLLSTSRRSLSHLQFTHPSGLIPILKHALLRTHASGATQRAALCHDGVVHVATERWDLGWGCGYRNFLMACAALNAQDSQPDYFPRLDHPIPPGVRNLQRWIENAWKEGFDKDGAEQLKHKLVGTKKWIGTAELYVAFVSRGIPAELVDFPKSKHGHQRLLDWVVNYFCPQANRANTSVHDALRGASPVVCTQKMPLILQHQGHSRTIIGYEISRSRDINLLIFDPARRPPEDIRTHAMTAGTTSLPSSPVKNSSLSPSKLLQRLFHPKAPSPKTAKRKHSPERQDSGSGSSKRLKSELQPILPNGDANIDLEALSRNQECTLDPSKTVKFFTLNLTKLRKNDQYQILYFPMTDLLGDEERAQRREVTSVRVT